MLATAGCSATKQTTQPDAGGSSGVLEQAAAEDIKNLDVATPGIPQHIRGLRNVPDASANQPLPNQVARPGVDFAADRMIVVWEINPDPAAIARYTGNNSNSGGYLAGDNHPLVDKPLFRELSHNFADHYGFSEFGRVFFRSVNFTCFELDGIEHIGQLDQAMTRVLDENHGLVREVLYDFHVHLDEVMRDDMPAAPDPASEAAEGEQYRATSAAPNDPWHKNLDGDSGGTWCNWRVGAIDGQAWDSTTGDDEFLVAVLDTGIRYTHEDLAANCITPAETAPFNEPGILTDTVNKDNDPNDDQDHGTIICGGIAGVGNNGKGIAGICQQLRVLPMKVTPGVGTGTESQLAEGMLLSDYLGCRILSMSLGAKWPLRLVQLAAEQIDDDGRLMLAGAGNFFTSAPFYPAYYSTVIGVGATTLVNDGNIPDFSTVDGSIPTESRYNARARFSNYGDSVEIAAPGVRVRSTDRASDSAYVASVEGTSAATPYASGCAALLWIHMGPEYSAHEVRGMLLAGATEMDHLNDWAIPKGFVDDTSNGPVRCINAWESIKVFDDGPYEAPVVTWINPVDDGTVGGQQDIQLSISGGDGTVTRVDFDTPSRHLGTDMTGNGLGTWGVPWDTTFEFNREVELTARVYDDVGNEVLTSIFVIPDNPRVIPPWTEGFDGVSLDGIAADWYMVDENGNASINTSWGADDAQSGISSPSMHSSGTVDNYAIHSNDWLYSPVIDLSSVAAPVLSFNHRYHRGFADAFYCLMTGDDEAFEDVIFVQDGLQDWDNIQLDLSQFAGGEVRIMWTMIVDGVGAHPGMWIDDVSISAGTGIAPTVEILTPADGATVSGFPQLDLLFSDDAEAMELLVRPVDLPGFIQIGIADNDPGNPTKSLSFLLDSRRTWNGLAEIRVLAYDDEDGGGSIADLLGQDSVTVQVDNPVKGSSWLDDFEDVVDLGGHIDLAPDGDWYRSSSDAIRWRTGTHDPWRGSQHAYMGPDGGGQYSASISQRLYSPVIDASQATNLHLRFWHSLDLEDGNDDKAMIYLVRYDGLQDLELNAYESRSDTAGYERAVLDLSAFSGDPFRLCFLLEADADADLGSGWSLDDIEVIDAAPLIDDVSPSRGLKGTTITLSGSNFGNIQGLSLVQFQREGGGLTTAVPGSWTHDALTVDVPGDARSG